MHAGLPEARANWQYTVSMANPAHAAGPELADHSHGLVLLKAKKHAMCCLSQPLL